MATRSKLLPHPPPPLTPPKSPLLPRKRRRLRTESPPPTPPTTPAKPPSPSAPGLRRSKRRCVLFGRQPRLDSARQCCLCAEALTGGELASPESCPGHNFHLGCLNNWLELRQRSGGQLACPMEACKRAFTVISVRREVGGKVIQQLPADRSFACPICQETIVGECATPNCCEHAYCPTCLREWSHSSATCPLDRQQFCTIQIWPRLGSRRLLRTVRIVSQAGGNNRQQQQQRRRRQFVQQQQQPTMMAAPTTAEPNTYLAGNADDSLLDVSSLLGYLRFMSIRRLADGDFYGYCFYSSLLRII